MVFHLLYGRTAWTDAQKGSFSGFSAGRDYEPHAAKERGRGTNGAPAPSNDQWTPLTSWRGFDHETLDGLAGVEAGASEEAEGGLHAFDGGVGKTGAFHADAVGAEDADIAVADGAATVMEQPAKRRPPLKFWNPLQGPAPFGSPTSLQRRSSSWTDAAPLRHIPGSW